MTSDKTLVGEASNPAAQDPPGAPEQAVEHARTRGSTRLSGRFPPLAVALIVLLTGLTLLLGYAHKARCVGPLFDASGRSQPNYEIRVDRDVCYSDIQNLWLGRDIDRHVFPYVNGGITPDGVLFGGSLEYPVLTGALVWVAAAFATNDGGFLLWSALLMLPFGLLTGWMLGRLSGWRALWWALGPPLVLYAFHNWDLPVVACAVGAVYAVHRWRLPSLPVRGAVAGALLGLGCAFKLYPGAFVLPLACHVLTRGGRSGELDEHGRKLGLDWAGAVGVLATAAGVVLLANLPFMVAGYDGWRASFTFQAMRK
ncbi:MAG: putative integral rane protein, partial [Pseudonocardia sp.]|nr:putative integral rane protein [Pseudonocardia sp.]